MPTHKLATVWPLRQHVAVMAFPFGCHPLSLLKLVQKLAIAAPHTHFSFFNTTSSNNSLFFTSTASDLPCNVKAYNVADGAPMNHIISGHSVERVELFMKATPDNFREGLEIAMTEMGQINCLITDAFLLFGGAIAEDLNVPWIPVWIPVPHSLSAHIYSDMIRKHYNINNLSSDNDSRDPENILEKIPGLGELRIADLPDEVLLNETQESLLCYMLSQVGNVLPQASALVMNFYKELYSTPLLDDLKTKFPSLLNVGFLTLSIPPCPLPLSNADATGCLSWLDSQKPTSVAYISFGTVVNIPSSEIVELAEALEETKLPFLWSLRDNLISKLPQGFLDRTKLDGKVVPWAPQNQVLAHNSINVYITHCGANSVYESMANGVPMICRPVFADNRINARIVEDIWGIGVRIDDGVFTKKGVIKSLELVLENEEGRRIRRKVHALQQLVFKAAKANGHAAQDFKTLVEKCSLK